MRPTPKTPPRQRPNPAFAGAFARLGAAVAQATTPSELSDSQKLQLIRLRVFGRIAEKEPQL
jgi:hypothetical protein